jgi:hypothetical protein
MHLDYTTLFDAASIIGCESDSTLFEETNAELGIEASFFSEIDVL